MIGRNVKKCFCALAVGAAIFGGMAGMTQVQAAGTNPYEGAANVSGRAAAKEVTCNTPVNAVVAEKKEGLITTVERTHWYKFTLPAAGMVSVSFSHAQMDVEANVAAWNVDFHVAEDGTAMLGKTSKAYQLNMQTIPVSLPAGTYYIKVEGQTAVTKKGDAYAMTVNYTQRLCETEPNNSIPKANVLASGKEVAGSIYGTADTADYYKIMMEKQGYISAEFDYDIVNADSATDNYLVSLVELDSNGNESVISSKTATAENPHLTFDKTGVTAGNYYLKVTGYQTDLAAGLEYQNSYRIVGTWKESNSWEVESNNTLKSANRLDSGKWHQGSISSVTDVDYYKIRAKKDGYLELSLTHEGNKNRNGEIEAAIYDEDGTELAIYSSASMDEAIKSPKIGVPAGTYYIKINGAATVDNLTVSGYTGSYKLKATAKAESGRETEPNGKQEMADRIHVGKSVKGISQSLADYDWYRFTLDKEAYVNLSISHSSINSDYVAWYATLYDGEGIRVKDGTKNIYVNSYAQDTYTESGAVKLKAGTYYVRAQAQNRVAVGKEYKLAVNKIGSAETKITEVKASSYNKLKIKWNTVPGAKEYAVYRSTSKNGSYKKVKTIENVSTASWTDKDVTTGKTYYYKVRTTVQSGSKKTVKYSAVKSGKATLGKVNAKVKTSGSNALKVSWEKISGAQGYKVYRSTSKDGKFKVVSEIKKGDTKTYTDKKLTKGKTYYYKVRAYRKVNGKTVYGSYSKVVSAKAK